MMGEDLPSSTSSFRAALGLPTNESEENEAEWSLLWAGSGGCEVYFGLFVMEPRRQMRYVNVVL